MANGRDIKRTRQLTESQLRKIELAVRYIIMTVLLVVFLGPFLWLVNIAFRGTGNIYELSLIPQDPTFQNFIDTWQNFGFGRAFVNSIIVAAMAVTSNILLCSLAAYPLARMEFPGKKIVFLMILATLMIPFQLYMIPLFLLCLRIGVVDTLIGIVLPTATGAFGIYLIKQYYTTIPRDLEEAGRIDGASEFGIWWRIMLPLTKPALAALGIFIFVGAWSNFLWPLIVINSDEKYVLTIQVAKLSGAFIDRTQYIAAGSVIAVFPVVVMFFFLQRFFIGGITLGSVKG